MNDEQVFSGNVTLPAGELNLVSPEASHLVRSLLKFNATERLTVDEALMHPWLCQHNDMLRKSNLTDKLPALRNFLARRKFKGGVHAVIASNKFNSFSKILKKQQQQRNADLPPLPPPEPNTTPPLSPPPSPSPLPPPPSLPTLPSLSEPIESCGEKLLDDSDEVSVANGTDKPNSDDSMKPLEIKSHNSFVSSIGN